MLSKKISKKKKIGIIIVVLVAVIFGGRFYARYQDTKNSMQLQLECFDIRELFCKIIAEIGKEWNLSEDLRIDNFEIFLTDKKIVPKQTNKVSFIDIYDYEKKYIYEVSWKYDSSGNCVTIDCERRNSKREYDVRFLLEDFIDCFSWGEYDVLHCDKSQLLQITFRQEVLKQNCLDSKAAERIYLTDITEKNAFLLSEGNKLLSLRKDGLKHQYLEFPQNVISK